MTRAELNNGEMEMTNDTMIAVINADYPVAATAIAKLEQVAQDAILTNGGDVVLKSGKSPNGLGCMVIARLAANGKCLGYFAVSGDGREQAVAAKHIEVVLSKVA